MINYMPIVPTQSLEQIDFDGARQSVMVLAHLCDPNCGNDYSKFYNKTKKDRTFVLLDNGAAEDSQIDDRKLMDIVQMLEPSCVVAPDCLFDGSTTARRSFRFIDKIKSYLPNVAVMCVPHGDSVSSFLETFDLFNHSDVVDWIGLSKFLSIRPFSDRVSAILSIHNSKREFLKPVHALGCNNPMEIGFFHLFEEIKSIDSCIAWLYGANNLDLPLDTSMRGRIETPKDFFDALTSDEQKRRSINNVRKIDELCSFSPRLSRLTKSTQSV